MRTFEAMLIIAISISVIGAHAEIEQVSIPFPGPYMLDCSYSVGEFLIFNCIWRSDRIPEDVKVALLDLEAVKELIGEKEVEASQAKIIMSWLSPPDPELIIEVEPSRPTVEDILKEKLDPGVREAVERLAECEYGKDEWGAIQQSSKYDVPDQIIAWDGNLRNDVLVKRLNLAYESCRIQDEYPLPGSYRSFWLADLTGLDFYNRTVALGATTNFTMGSDIYAPLTEEDFAGAIKNATDWQKTAPYIDPTLGCIPRDAQDTRCQARGNPEPIIKDLKAYNAYINFKAGQIQTPQDYADTIAEAKAAQCTVHYPIYAHKVGSERLPEWLEHCETFVEEFERTGIACYKGKEQILCAELRKLQDDR